MSVFADSSQLEEGDCALILRDDGTFQLVSNIQPGEGDRVERRHVQHMLLILGLYMMATSDEAVTHLTGMGASPEGQAIAAQAAPTRH